MAGPTLFRMLPAPGARDDPGRFRLHNHMYLNVGRRLSTLPGIAYSTQRIAVDVVVGLVCRG